MKIAVIGTGYVGLVSGTCFAEIGHNVTCVDKSLKKIDMLNNGKMPIYEAGLETLVKKNVKAKKLRFTTDLREAIRGAAAVFIAVGTPPDGDDGGADLSYVFAAASEFAMLLSDNMVVVTKSTVPVGTGDRIEDIIKKARPKLKFHVASNPEFLREGCAVKDFLEPERIIVGVSSPVAEKIMREIYRPFLKKAPIMFTDIRTAELTKYASNAFLATRISFINEMADICERVGANIGDVAKGMGMDHRIGPAYLQPGPGFGGSCFPKDTLALRKIANDAGSPTKIVESVIYSNERRKLAMAEKIINACVGVHGKTIAILGLAFKANTDDMRHSPALMILSELVRAGASLRVYDPQAMKKAEEVIAHQKIKWCEDSYDAIEGAHAAVIVTEWYEFRKLNMDKVKRLLKKPMVIDLRNIYSPEIMKKKGFKYISVGR